MNWYGITDVAELLEGPVITIQGDHDDIVPFSQAKQLHAALDKAGVPNQLIPIPGAGHDGFSRQALIESYAAVREFLRKNGILNRE